MRVYERDETIYCKMVEELDELAKIAYESIFGDERAVEVEGKTRRVRRTSRQGLRFLSVDNYTFLEQNPGKNSVWGRLAREGHKILWIIEDGDYVGQVRDGAYHDFHKEH